MNKSHCPLSGREDLWILQLLPWKRMAQLQLKWLLPSSFALTETVLCLETYNDVAKDYLFGWFVASFHTHTRNYGYRTVFLLITTVLDYSASARERRMTKLSFIDKLPVTKNSFKHVQCFYRVKETQVHVWLREMLWEKSHRAVSTAFSSSPTLPRMFLFNK